MKRKLFILTVLLAATGVGAAAMLARRGDTGPEVVTDVVSRGDIVSLVSASGTLEAVTTVQVGTQVSGTVRNLYADFNSVVKKGQVLARLDPSLFETEIEQAQANLIRAEAEVDRLRVTLADATVKLERARELSARQLIPATELDAADVTRRTVEAQLRSAAAQVTQARATLSQTNVNLQKTVITSPIDGIVIARNVDIGQTVAASLQAPTLFLIAADLTQMQVKASVDESDLGQIQAGQTVRFTVDAYPTDRFEGVVRQVRLNPVVEQNVVTYAAIISAPNPELKLRPGMTANVSVEVARRDDVLRVPTSALRFKPADDVLAALGGDSSADGRRTDRAPAATTRPRGTSGQSPAASSGAAVWAYDGALRRIPVRVGVSDGTFVELIEGTLEEGTPLVTRVTLKSGDAAPASATSGNPLMGQTPPRRF